MEQSPLTRQLPPETFQPKIVQLYESLFKLTANDDQDDDDHNDGDGHDDDDDDGDAHAPKSDGFWTEFFILRPDPDALRKVLDELGQGDAVLQHEARTRELFARSVATVKARRGPADAHALETLSVFLSTILVKKYAHASSDVIAALAGIDRVDAVMTDFVGALDGAVKHAPDYALRIKAVDVILAVTAGAYQTSLLTYLIQRDLFPALIKFIQDSQTPQLTRNAFTLLGLLANYNKFEFQNPYQMRLADFVNEAAIARIVRCVGSACLDLRTAYTDIQDDLPEGWSLSSALGMIGLGKREKKKSVWDEDTAKAMFAKLPGPEAAVLLATYDFTHTNKLFCFNLVTLPAEKALPPTPTPSTPSTPAPTPPPYSASPEAPFASFISLTSYLLQHAPSSQRTTLYSNLSLTILRLIVEDTLLCRRLCAPDAGGNMVVRMCRQRPPHLPLVRGERAPAAAVLDAMVSGIDHNLRRRLDVGLYTLCVGIILRIISYLSRSRTRLAYHWNELFRSLLSLIKFLTTYVADLKGASQIETLLDHVVNILALSLSAGEAFLPSATEYDDLFYKVVEAGDTLFKFKSVYGLANRGSNSIDTLLSVSSHYKQQLVGGDGSSGDGSGAGSTRTAKDLKNLTSIRVAEVIKEGYETLSIQTKEGLDSWERFREAGERSLMKIVARTAVEDVKAQGKA